METLGARLKRARERANKTQGEACKALGISIGTLSGYERDYRKPDADTLAKLAATYDVSIDYLVTGKESGNEDSRSSEQQEFLEWVEDNLEEAFFYDFHKSPEEQKKQFLETMRALWEVEKKRGNIKPRE
ncbi:helix-turn-helix domain-containing protein [Alicyclobacillus fastidiosus]|uniref:Helix-turn-helix transcriptional regulator n=1 Tax=Alicyclobacillus fastidiosus TaxID=392011 RepID=A0ABV5AKY9_9BACL|nr:helix-turn-helix transcriptional regulator [Alicyclobacillus fastidiosus]WEH09312.1 helix-turn-helix transcriptional regulator [Alicyclobacillus fastidiosus]